MATTTPWKEEDRVDEKTKPPFLRRVRIKGYKSIAFCDVALQPLTILVGRNAAGKSNFLDALAFLRDVVDINLPEAVRRRGGWSSLVNRTGDRSRIEFEIEAAYEFTPSGHKDEEGGPYSVLAKYALFLKANDQGQPNIAFESLDIQGHQPDQNASFQVQGGIIERSSPGVSHPFDIPHSGRLFRMVRPDQPLLSVIGTQPCLGLGDGLRVMGFYNFHPDSIRRPQKPSRGTILERDGNNVASVLASLREIDPDAVERIRDYLSLITGETRRIDIVQSGEWETVEFLLQPEGASYSIAFGADSMSDGTLRALASLIAAFQVHLPSGPTVVGIEEPETALHPAAMRALVDAMDEATQRTQILLTTHSADLLSGRDLTPGQVLVVRNRGGQTHITPVDPASRQIIEKELYSLADLQRMDRLDLDETDLKRQAQLANGAKGV